MAKSLTSLISDVARLNSLIKGARKLLDNELVQELGTVSTLYTYGKVDYKRTKNGETLKHRGITLKASKDSNDMLLAYVTGFSKTDIVFTYGVDKNGKVFVSKSDKVLRKYEDGEERKLTRTVLNACHKYATYRLENTNFEIQLAKYTRLIENRYETAHEALTDVLANIEDCSSIEALEKLINEDFERRQAEAKAKAKAKRDQAKRP